MMFMPVVNDMLDDFFDDDDFDIMPVYDNGTASLMKTDVEEKDGKYIMKVNVPGLNKKDIRISLKNGNLVVSANRNENHDEKDSKGHVIRQERYEGSYARSWYVGKDVKENDIHASLKDGVLTLDLPDRKNAPAVENNHYIAIE